jgi:hypothetical protein
MDVAPPSEGGVSEFDSHQGFHKSVLYTGKSEKRHRWTACPGNAGYGCTGRMLSASSLRMGKEATNLF